MGETNISSGRKKAGRKPENLTIDLKVEFVPMEESHIEAWRAGIDLLLRLLEEKEDYEKEIQEKV